ncbi:NUDIX hydrolase [Janibacter sp. Soil728]|uniref:NUDIX domain-containing protein n=1 Tax=Janibacter sp. Soil728 TaxID=1736393 RepID=UPI0006FCA348|nr:NUDIX domain-containing protein [Janibacter sp. Soil728]KRE37229.1 NUDIX hydrolase [Janibacter sp. Soil728]
MARTSAGLLPFVVLDGSTQVFLGHMGGPLWTRRPRGWTVIKGEVEPEEELLAAAEREFTEETGAAAPPGPRIPLGEIRQSGGKVVHAWAVRVSDPDSVRLVRTGSFEMEWPPRSGRRQSFPELDLAQWYDLDAARDLVVAAQTTFLDRVAEALAL